MSSLFVGVVDEPVSGATSSTRFVFSAKHTVGGWARGVCHANVRHFDGPRGDASSCRFGRLARRVSNVVTTPQIMLSHLHTNNSHSSSHTPFPHHRFTLRFELANRLYHSVSLPYLQESIDSRPNLFGAHMGLLRVLARGNPDRERYDAGMFQGCCLGRQ